MLIYSPMAHLIQYSFSLSNHYNALHLICKFFTFMYIITVHLLMISESVMICLKIKIFNRFSCQIDAHISGATFPVTMG